jgi:hypothetical protein
MMIRIDYETHLSFEFEVWDNKHETKKTYLVRQNGGEWQLMQDGAVIGMVARSGTKWQTALIYAIEHVEMLVEFNQ